ncbi:hypothetical protein AAVH_22485 [Aphelenchoides avenae]|nr:hypothetical protein AAVH_22485 [Aphelenchus avenae]
MERLCTQCAYCDPRAVDYVERLYDRFHLSTYSEGEYHFIHVQTRDNKWPQTHKQRWQMVYARAAVPQAPPPRARKKSRISCGDVLFDACSFLSRTEIDGIGLVGRQWISALRGVSSGLPLRPLFVVVKNERVILHSIQQLPMSKAAPHVVIDKITLGLTCDEAVFGDALLHSNVLSLKWEGMENSATDQLQDPTKSREERRPIEVELHVNGIIARHMKSAAVSVE